MLWQGLVQTVDQRLVRKHPLSRRWTLATIEWVPTPPPGLYQATVEVNADGSLQMTLTSTDSTPFSTTSSRSQDGVARKGNRGQ